MEKLTRRQLLFGAASAGGSGLLALWFGGKAFAQTNPLLPDAAPAKFSYLTSAEIAFVDAALDRLIPSDKLGPGARESGGTWFIDQQLAGPFGRGDRWYMQGPWREGTDEQGYQLKYTPAQLYRAAIRGIDDYCRANHGGKAFAGLPADVQDKVLQGLEGGKIALRDASGKDFFKMLLQNAQESFLADPIYGGNQHFTGWKLIGFPGPRYNYVNDIEQHGKRYTLPTVGLSGRDGVVRRRT
ncbi:gluconate 2-dehydrogenase subunit 3 family protein [Oxalobacteraceae bacterium OM1]|nr:gluconate 2-dehydrogenase subunit 3 family protein [Oxalobacteraceae bacterium OM1]